MIKNLVKSHKNLAINTYHASVKAKTRAKAITDDLIAAHQTLRTCSVCGGSDFKLSADGTKIQCVNLVCAEAFSFVDPLFKCQLNQQQILTLIAMMIDNQNLNQIAYVLQINLKPLRKIREIFLEQINWNKYKIDRDFLTVREVYAKIGWSFIK